MWRQKPSASSDAAALKRNLVLTEHQEDLDSLLDRLRTSASTGITAEQV